MCNNFSLFIQVLLLPFPWWIRRRFLGWILGFDIRDGASIGFSLILCRNVLLSSGSRVAHCNLIKGLDLFDLGVNSSVGSFNWFTGDESVMGKQSFFCMARESAVTSRHYFDCRYGITIKEFTTVAGIRSTFFSHSMDLYACRQDGKGIIIGSYCFIGSHVLLLPGVDIQERTVVGAGLVLPGREYGGGQFYLGQPPRQIAPKGEVKYFSRMVGYVD